MGQFISPHKVFSHLDRLAAWQNSETPAPVTIEWDLSNRCSLGCRYGDEGLCHFAHTHTRGPWAGRAFLPMAFESTGDFADPSVVRRALREAAEFGAYGVVWSGGGEPTLHPDLDGIVAHAASCGLQQGMYTLGGHVTPDLAEALAPLEWAVVSLDCVDADSYGAEKGVSPERFYQACQGVRNLVARGPKVVGVSFLLHGANWTRCREMLDLARNLGATYATFRPAIATSPDRPGHVAGDTRWIDMALDEDFNTILQQVAREPDVEIDLPRFRAYRNWAGHGYNLCYGIRLNTTVTPDGRVWICPQRRGIQGSCLGDLRSESFAAIWARHPGAFAVDGGCRAMCRLHQVNELLSKVYTPRQHEAFV